MGKTFRLVGILAGVMVTITSCLSSDETEITLYNDAVITNFYITTAKVEKHTTSSLGEDSVYTETNTNVANITFQIDHYEGRIYNLDSLPYGTNAQKLLCSYSTKNNGVVAIKTLESEENENEWVYLSTTDSIDFSVERQVKVYAYNDTELTRQYTIEVRVKQTPEVPMVWQNVGKLADFETMQNARLLAYGDNVVLLASDGTSTTIYRNNGSTFEKMFDNEPANLYANAVTYVDAMAVFNGTSIKYMQGDFEIKEERTPDDGISQLLAMDRSHIYAINDNGKIVMSSDYGEHWQEDVLDDDASNLPDKELAAISVLNSRNKNVDNTILIGKCSTNQQDHMMSWLKISTGSDSDKWTLMTGSEQSANTLPTLSKLSMTAADSGLLLATGADADGKIEKLYISCDGGITWKQNSDYTLPEVAKGATAIVLCMDNANVLWAICCGTGEIWRCNMNE